MKLICVCDKAEDKETCLNKCPKGKAIKPTACFNWPEWKQESMEKCDDTVERREDYRGKN